MNPLFVVLLFSFGESPIGFIIALAAFFFLGRMLYGIFKDGAKIAKTHQVKTGTITHSNEAENAVDYQLRNFAYYRKLSSKGRIAFIRRILNFLETHTIEGNGDFEPALSDKIDVSAAAAQLTFGMPGFMFSHFDRIILYPGAFRIHPDAPLMKGAAHPNGVIHISIKDFDAGYANPSDKLNVGLHEFAHALFMELVKHCQQEATDVLKTNFTPYMREADKVLNEEKDADFFLRNYAFSNRHEFFAVGIEHFFEAPKEFKEKIPHLYNAFKNLLGQDPAGVLADYGVLLH